jgi:DNA-binding transcriptional MerR regulator
MTGTGTQTAIEERLYRIGEVSRLSELKPFVLRYWETEFPMLEPVKSPSGHRMYRQEDVDMVFKIKRLLYDEGFTIAGARRHLRETNGAIGAEAAAHSGGSGQHAQYAQYGSAAGSGNTGGTTSYSAHGGHPENAGELLSRKMLLDLRDTLRAFLTLLEQR